MADNLRVQLIHTRFLIGIAEGTLEKAVVEMMKISNQNSDVAEIRSIVRWAMEALGDTRVDIDNILASEIEPRKIK